MRRRRSYIADNIAAEYDRKKLYAKRKRQKCIIDNKMNCDDCIYNGICIDYKLKEFEDVNTKTGEVYTEFNKRNESERSL